MNILQRILFNINQGLIEVKNNLRIWKTIIIDSPFYSCLLFYWLISDQYRKPFDYPRYFQTIKFLKQKGFTVQSIGGACPFQLIAFNNTGTEIYIRSKGNTRIELNSIYQKNYPRKPELVIYHPIDYLYEDEEVFIYTYFLFKEIEEYI